ncbi:MAG: MBL fold metallo-hydrolase, partial [Candidatus Woesearchaeota archaeon]
HINNLFIIWLMQVSVIASGSNGNCCLVEDKNAGILFDAGLSCREIEQRMNRIGKSLENVDAIVVSHSHTDHVRGAGVISRKYGIPVLATSDTCCEAAHYLGRNVKKFSACQPFKIAGMKVLPVQTSHDVASCGFVIGKFGIFTDTGTVTLQMLDALPSLDAVLLESNHDVDMLLQGPYPRFLKYRILGDAGHLSNFSASELVQNYGIRLRHIFLGHLSSVNNTPDKAKETFKALVSRQVDFCVCSREKETGVWNI